MFEKGNILMIIDDPRGDMGYRYTFAKYTDNPSVILVYPGGLPYTNYAVRRAMWHERGRHVLSETTIP